jgi:hypothetical protein
MKNDECRMQNRFAFTKTEGIAWVILVLCLIVGLSMTAFAPT